VLYKFQCAAELYFRLISVTADENSTRFIIIFNFLCFFCITFRPIYYRMTQPLTKMSTSKLPAGIKRPARRADNIAAIYEQISENVGASTSRNHKGLHDLYRDNFTFFYIIQ
jgi:hypothetical protein